MVVPDGGNSGMFADITDQLYRKIGRMGFHNTIKLIRTYKLPLIKLVMTAEF